MRCHGDAPLPDPAPAGVPCRRVPRWVRSLGRYEPTQPNRAFSRNPSWKMGMWSPTCWETHRAVCRGLGGGLPGRRGPSRSRAVTHGHRPERPTKPVSSRAPWCGIPLGKAKGMACRRACVSFRFCKTNTTSVTAKHTPCVSSGFPPSEAVFTSAGRGPRGRGRAGLMGRGPSPHLRETDLRVVPAVWLSPQHGGRPPRPARPHRPSLVLRGFA